MFKISNYSTNNKKHFGLMLHETLNVLLYSINYSKQLHQQLAFKETKTINLYSAPTKLNYITTDEMEKYSRVHIINYKSIIFVTPFELIRHKRTCAIYGIRVAL